MRFLLGVLLGGAVTVLVATAVDGPTQALFDRGLAAVKQGGATWDDWWRAAGQRVFPAPQRPPEPAVAVSFERASPGPAHAAPAANPETEIPSRAGTLPDSPVAGAPEPAEIFAVANTAEKAPPSVATPAMRPLPESPSPARVATHAELVRNSQGVVAGAHSGSAKETVWVPFRSQMSAQGFAAALSAKTQHPFEVERQGPGRYQVLFSYVDSKQRDELLQRVQSLTSGSP